LSTLEQVDLLRIRANSDIDPKVRSALGQFFTASPICLYMVSLFNQITDDVKLLDPGCGPGSLTASFVDEALRRKSIHALRIDAFDIEERIKPYINETLNLCKNKASEQAVKLEGKFRQEDFIISNSGNFGLFSKKNDYTHVIMNPPYKKINSISNHRKALSSAGIETVNLYTGFVALAIKNLRLGGELVAIIPRSFCNGLYYKEFRKLLLNETAIQHIHVFDSRSNAFSQDDVLQENIIIHLIKGVKQGDIVITSSPSADFKLLEGSGNIAATDETTRVAPFEEIVNSNDAQNFIHIVANERDQRVVDKLSCFNTLLDELNLQVSTGPIVSFRLKDDLRENIEKGAVPLVSPVHLNGHVQWPKDSKKPNAIVLSSQSKKWLWVNSGNFVIVKRFSSKEEKKRIVATLYDGSLSFDQIGFDNKLNVFHFKKQGFDKEIAVGLFVYLNSTLLDKSYRLFGGHTQVNATDLRTIWYPNIESLKRLGRNLGKIELNQEKIDHILDQEIIRVSGNIKNPLHEQKKIDQALEIIIALGMPRAQQNERSALTFLALTNLHPEDSWGTIERPMIGVTPIMDWCRDVYGKEYAPNTRETFRRQTLHQFLDGGLCLYNPDKPDRPVNSPKACYQLTTELFDVLQKYGTDDWRDALDNWLKNRKTLAAQYAMEREMQMIPLTLDDGSEIKLSPGIHSQLIRDIVTEFGPRFAPSSEVIYLGDTGAKEDFFRKDRLAELGVIVNRKGKLPDVVLYWSEKDWLLLIESVTSHGPVDGKRHGELSKLFEGAKPGLVYVTAFPNRKIMAKYLSDISWETEVWAADAPTHMIHFNGDRFLGPHKKA